MEPVENFKKEPEIEMNRLRLLHMRDTYSMFMKFTEAID